MREYISGYIIANTIRMARTQFIGSFLMVEGDTDARLYKRFVDTDRCKVIPAHSKDNALGALLILEQGQVEGVLTIADADFTILEGQSPTSPNILLTDTHDLETMLINSPALEGILIEFGSEEKLTTFTRQTGKDVRQQLLESGVPVGYLRWISLIENLSLKFEELEFSKFIDKDNLALDKSKLIKAVKEKSQRLDITESHLVGKMEQLKSGTHDYWHVCCGHDLVCILSFGLRKALGTCNPNDVKQAVLERSLRLAFEISYFSRTQLHSSILNWEKANEPYLILSAGN